MSPAARLRNQLAQFRLGLQAANQSIEQAQHHQNRYAHADVCDFVETAISQGQLTAAERQGTIEFLEGLSPTERSTEKDRIRRTTVNSQGFDAASIAHDRQIRNHMTQYGSTYAEAMTALNILY
jgi:hypothetical protein